MQGLKRLLQAGLVVLCVVSITSITLGNEQINKCIKARKWGKEEIFKVYERTLKTKPQDEAWKDAWSYAWQDAWSYAWQEVLTKVWDAEQDKIQRGVEKVWRSTRDFALKNWDEESWMATNHLFQEQDKAWQDAQGKAWKDAWNAWKDAQGKAWEKVEYTKEYRAWEAVKNTKEYQEWSRAWEAVKNTKEYRAWGVAWGVAWETSEVEWKKVKNTKEYQEWSRAWGVAWEAWEALTLKTHCELIKQTK